jgi:RsiW-degrading membrane proteinase PrsW (M82 family)
VSGRAAGQATIQVGTRAIPLWLAATVAGAATWLGIMLVDTGSEGLDALWTAAAYLAPLILAGSLSRTVSLRNLATVTLAGGFMLGVALLAIKGFEAFDDDPASTLRDFAVPLLEESLKLAPVLLFLWIGRHGRTWTLGATDLLLLGAAAGAGFGLVEDAYIRDRFGWNDQVSWLPIAEINGGRVIAGHALWTSLASLAIGYGLLLRCRGAIALAAALAGLAWSVFDHAANNYAAGHESSAAERLQSITGDGWLTIWAVVLGGIAAIAIDAAIQRRTIRSVEALAPPGGFTRETWAYRLAHRALAVGAFQHYRADGPAASGAERAIRELARSLYLARFDLARPTDTPAQAPAHSGE